MAKVIIDFEQTRPFQDGDMLIYNERLKKFVLTTKELYLRGKTNEIRALKEQYEKDIAELKTSVETFKKGVNDKLKNYHEILQNLTKEQ